MTIQQIATTQQPDALFCDRLIDFIFARQPIIQLCLNNCAKSFGTDGGRRDVELVQLDFRFQPLRQPI